jgi:iron complex outermembrane receptor protein
LDQNQENTGSFFATNRFNLGNGISLKIGGGVRHVGRQVSGIPGGFVVVTPQRTLVDAIAEASYGPWTLQVNALNLLDKFYYSGCSQYNACTSGEPRMVNATIRYRF